MRTNNNKQKVLLFLIVLFGFLIRSILLDKVPPAMTHDELGYVYNSYSIAKIGEDVNGISFPWNFDTVDPKSPVPVYLVAPIVGLFGLNQVTSRILFSVLGSIGILLVYLIAKNISENQNIALISSFIYAILPWNIHLSRIAYDGVIGLFFLMLAIALLTIKKTKYSYLIIAGLSLFLSFFSYHAYKVLFIPLLVILFWYLSNQWKSRKTAFIYITSISLIIGMVFIFTINRSNVLSRYDEVTVFKTDIASNEVNFERRTSSAPQLIRKIYNNKLTFFIKKLRDNYLESFSTEFLFTRGESSAIYSVWYRGQLYFIDAIFLLIALIAIGKKFDKKYLFLFSLLLISPLPATITNADSHSKSLSLRIMLMTVPITILIAEGIYYFIVKIIKNKRIFSIVLVIFLYLILLSSYLYQYFYRYPIYASRYLSQAERTVVELSYELKQTFNQVIICPSDNGILWEYAFYGNIHPKDFQKLWEMKNVKNIIDNIVIYTNSDAFYSEVDSSEDLENQVVIMNTSYLSDSEKIEFLKEYQLEIRDPNDSGGIWKIFTSKKNIQKIKIACPSCFIIK